MKMRLLSISLIIIMIGCTENSEQRKPESYILPDGYIGSFYIIHNARNGMKHNIDDGVLIYEIPDKGILISQMPANYGWIDSSDINFYYQQANGERSKINGRITTSIRDNLKNRENSELIIWGGGTGMYEHQDISCALTYSSFSIGTRKDILDGVNYFDFEEFKDELNRLSC